MAKIGLSKPYFAKYTNVAGVTTYSEGTLIGKATELSMELDSDDSNVLYADNGIAESDNAFGGGSITLSTDDLMPAPLINILGVKSQTITGVEGVTTEGASWLINDDEQETPYGALGVIVKRKINNQIKYCALIYPKIQFQNFGDSVVTQGESIEWQVSELSAVLMRDDTTYHEWRRISTPLDTEAEAEALIKNYLNIA